MKIGRSLTVVTATIALAGLAACGGDGDARTDREPTARPGGLGESVGRLKLAKDATVAGGSLDVTMSFAMTVGGREAGFTMTGVTDLATGAGRFELDADGAGGGDAAEVISDGETVWMSSDGQRWIEVSVDGLTQSSQASTDPTELLNLLDEAGDVAEVGGDEVNGVRTTRYHAEVDFDLFAEARGIDLDAEALDELGIDGVPMDIWIDADNVIRQFQLTMEGSLDGTTIRVEIDVDTNPSREQVVVDGPPAGEIVPREGADLNDVIAGS